MIEAGHRVQTCNCSTEAEAGGLSPRPGLYTLREIQLQQKNRVEVNRPEGSGMRRGFVSTWTFVSYDLLSLSLR